MVYIGYVGLIGGPNAFAFPDENALVPFTSRGAASMRGFPAGREGACSKQRAFGSCLPLHHLLAAASRSGLHLISCQTQRMGSLHALASREREIDSEMLTESAPNHAQQGLLLAGETANSRTDVGVRV